MKPVKTMSIVDIQPESDKSTAEEAKSLGAMPPTMTESDPSSSSSEGEKGEKEAIVLDGPLSKIYTQALQIAYSRKAERVEGEEEVQVAKEKMAIDASMMGVMEVVDEEAANSPKPLYVYVTDSASVEKGDVALEALDRLRVSVESGRYAGVWFCTEDGYRLGRHQVILSDYVSGVGGRVYYSQASLWRALGL